MVKTIFKSTILVVWCLLFSPAFSQEDIDYSKLINKATSIRSSNPNEFRKTIALLSKERLKLSKDQKDELLYLEAYSSAFSGDMQRGMEIAKSILDRNPALSTSIKTRVLLINFYLPLSDWESGAEHLFFIIRNSSTSLSDEIHELTTTAIAFSYLQLAQFDRAVEYISNVDITHLSSRGRCFIFQMKIESKIGANILLDNSELKEAKEECSYANEIVALNLINLYWSDYIVEQDPRLAISILDSIKLEKTGNFPFINSHMHAVLAAAYLQVDDYSNSQKYANLALVENGSPNAKKTMLRAYQVLFRLSEKKGNSNLALEYYKKYAELYKYHLNETQAKTFAFQMAELKLIEKENEIKRLNDQNALLLLKQNLNQTEKENSRLFMLLMGGSLVLLSAFFYRTKVTQLRLKRLAEFDHLTGVFNRGHFTYLARKSLQYDEEAAVAASYILFDLDFFKQINDKHGHPTGDWALRKVAAVCKRQCRKSDLFARLGGEEFCFFLPGSTKETACRMAEHCRRAIEAIDTSETGHNFKITASFGVSDTGQSGFSIAKLMADADAAMYSSKREGRNLVSVYEKDNPKDWPFRAPYVKVDVCLPPSKYGQNKYEPDFSADKWYES